MLVPVGMSELTEGEALGILGGKEPMVIILQPKQETLRDLVADPSTFTMEELW